MDSAPSMNIPIKKKKTKNDDLGTMVISNLCARKLDLEKLNNWPKVTQAICGRIKIKMKTPTQGCLTPESTLKTHKARRQQSETTP